MVNILKIILSIILWIFPWPIRRIILNTIFGYKISPNAKIGFSIIIPGQLIMLDCARIGHLTMCKNLEIVKLGVSSRIGNLNWISGFPLKDKSSFSHQTDREPSLIIGNHASMTHRHLIDCTDKITIGDFTTIAGNRSYLLTHSIDILESKQDCKPIQIGSYCLVGTTSVLLPGSSLGDYCVLGANSLLNKSYTEQYCLYGGVPAVLLKEMPKDAKYFSRKSGYIH